MKLKPGLSYIIKDDSCYLNYREQVVSSNNEISYSHKKLNFKKGDVVEFLGRKLFPGYMIGYATAHYFSFEIKEKEYMGEFHPILNTHNFEKYLEKKPGIFSDLLNM